MFEEVRARFKQSARNEKCRGMSYGCRAAAARGCAAPRPVRVRAIPPGVAAGRRARGCGEAERRRRCGLAWQAPLLAPNPACTVDMGHPLLAPNPACTVDMGRDDDLGW